MTFSTFCIGFVIILVVLLATGLFGWVTSRMSDNDDMWIVVAWLMSAAGFAICLTTILIEKRLLS